MQKHRRALVSPRPILTYLLILFTTVTHGDSLERLLMPGELIDAHKKYEENCEQCHDTSDKQKQGVLCIHCHDHENILDDLSSKTGFHGRLPEQTQYDCKHCHTDHTGRDANIVLLNRATFDHTKTDFRLEGTHAQTSCNSCHQKEKKYSETPADCYSCHKKADKHKGNNGKKCGNCHKSTHWNDLDFDHDKTDFKLEGAHKKTSCNACHVNRKYKDTAKECISCHQIDNVHRTKYGKIGKKCDTCHNSEKWQKARFDHNNETDFRLYGKHRKTSCDSCHTGSNTRKKMPTDCYSCHKNDDSHKGRNGKKCNDCHGSSSWGKQKFDHDRKTDFPLRGKHSKTACNLCHKGELYKSRSGTKDKTRSECFTCHRKDDVHRGKQGKKCDNCHNEKGWRHDVSFDHDLARFPLIGMHAVTHCDECHLNTEYSSTESECNSCHAEDDVHETRLGQDCETCHTPNSWKTWLFNHDKATDFKIDGAHEFLGCYDCHKSRSDGKLRASKDCIFCHRSRDAHDRKFGRHCDQCHDTDSFKNATVR